MSWKNKSTVAPSLPGQLPDVPPQPALPKGATLGIVGAGAFGGWAALSLLRKGYNVTLIDPWGGGNSRASSGGETRLIRCVYGGNSFYTELALEAYRLWQDNEKTFEKQLLFPTGNLWLANENDNDLKAAIAIMDNMNLQYESLSPEEAKRKFPYLHTADLGHILWEKHTGYLKAREGCQAVVEQFVKEGGSYLPLAATPGKTANGEMENLRLSDGSTFKADRYLFAAGPWMKSLFEKDLSPLLEVTRQEVYYFGVNTDSSSKTEAGLPTWIDLADPGGYYGIPGGIGRGFKIASDVRGPAFDPTNGQRTPSDKGIEKARRYISHRFPGMGSLPLLEARVCQYSNTPDGNLFFDVWSEASNTWLLGGGSGHGYKHGPALGQLVADVFEGKRILPPILSLSRFHAT